MKKEEVLEKIEGARRFGKDPGVTVSKKMLRDLDHPEESLAYIHVAGTNGKGSVCTFLETMSMALGLKTGKFTSPHLVSFNERITVNGKQIPDEDLTRLGQLLLEKKFDAEPTMFDYSLALALLYFREQKCDLVILETGLGGRLDSTRALSTDPLACVITRIGFDHMAILGNTLKEIAGEKAGILRPGVPLICGPQEEEALAAIRSACGQLNEDLAPLMTLVTEEAVGETVSLKLKMIGSYQKENAAIALCAMRRILPKLKASGKVKRLGKEEEAQLLGRALEAAVWPGRMEILSEAPFLLADGAHNSNGVSALAESLRALYPGERFHFVMGVMADKDYPVMIEELLPLALDFVTVTPESSRALQGSRLAQLIRAKGIPARFEENWKDFLEAYLNKGALESCETGGREKSAPGRLICFGSLYFIGEVRALVKAE